MINADAQTPDRRRVLVVEDEAAVQASLAAFLTHHGFSTLRAASVDEVLSALNGVRVDAVTLDIHIPDESGLNRSGFAVLQAMRLMPLYERVPVVIFTGIQLPSKDEDHARSLGAVIVQKPLSYKAVLDCLNELSAN